MLPAIVRCSWCGCAYSLDEPLWECPSHGSPLEVRPDFSGLGLGTTADLLAGETPVTQGAGRYSRLIPVDSDQAVSMGEGCTPVVRLSRLGSELGLGRLYAKLEYFSPPGSFKDRGTAVLLTKTRELGVKRLLVRKNSIDPREAVMVAVTGVGLKDTSVLNR